MARSQRKVVVIEKSAKTSGASIGAEEAAALLSSDKAAKVISLFRFAMTSCEWSEKILGATLGQLVFMTQFRRPTFVC